MLELKHIVIFLLYFCGAFVDLSCDKNEQMIQIDNTKHFNSFNLRSSIELDKILGFYEYISYEYDDTSEIDTFRCQVEFIKNFENKYSVIQNELLDIMLVDSKHIFGIWSVDSINNKLFQNPISSIPRNFKLVINGELKTNSSMNQELLNGDLNVYPVIPH